MHAGVVMLECSRGRLLLRRSRCGTRCRLANRELHGGDLLQLVDDDFLRDAPQLFVLAVTQFADRHVDRALMMRGHHSDEIAVDIACRLYLHVAHHLDHRGLVLFQERSFVGDSRRRRLSGRVGFVCKDVWRKRKGDEKARAEDRGAETWSPKLARERCDDATKEWLMHCELRGGALQV